LKAEEHTQWVGAIVTNLQALETVLRYFLAKLRNEVVEFPKVGDQTVKLSYLTRRTSLGKLIRTFNGALAEAEKKLKANYGSAWDEMFPPDEYYQVMHLKLFPLKLVHAENVGGEIDKVSNQRAWIGAFPLRGIEMESAMCRIVAMLPPQ
jgi:hypothetical protein